MRAGLTSSIVLCAVFAASAAPAASTDADVRDAIVSAVRARLGTAGDVRVEELQVRGNVDSKLVAVPAPGARTGTRIRFSLRAANSAAGRVGEADALVYVVAPHFRATRTVHRGTPLTKDVVVEENGDLGSVLLQTLPRRDALAGSVAARDIAEGDILTMPFVTTAAFVKAGDKVLVTVTAGAVQVQATLVAAQSGGLGDIVRCVNPETRKAMNARIVGPGVAEAIHAF